jgi:hypothetical protein
MPVSHGGLLLFAAGLAGALHGAPGIGLLLLLAGLPIFVRMATEHANGPNGGNWFGASAFYLIALLIALSPLLFTAVFAALWVVCAAMNSALGGFRGTSTPADVDSRQVLVSVTMGLCGLALLLRRCLLSANARAIESAEAITTAGSRSERDAT